MRTPAQQDAWERYWAGILEAATVVFVVQCDGPGCSETIEATHKDRRAAGWCTRWRRRPGTGVEDQVDLCPTCRRGAGKWPPPKGSDER